ncbi:DUF6777 domain-containing protein [Streptomyces wuyuanensis]|uniref:DUF6777 domain-containing protein n=1 Tax=Streptomyces wuyuanensis TaxID=1196353 RepID=UPI003792EA6A
MSAGTAIVVAMAVILAFSLMGGGSQGGGEIFLQTASAAGRDPFTPSSATDTKGAEAPSGPDTSRIGSRTVAVSGAHPGLYGGTQNVASCDVEKQITYLAENQAKGSAFAGALRIPSAEIPAYLRSLTPVRLTWDTRVTNHGYRDGRATEYQAVLQAGTAVLVDARGVPRVRCACGNPLAPAVAVQGEQKYTGKKWASFRSAAIVAVVPAPKPMKAVTMFDPETKAWFERPNGDAEARSDHRIPAPKGQPPDGSAPVLPEPSDDSSDLFPEGDERSEPEGEDQDTPDGGTDEDKEKGTEDEKKDGDQQKEDEPSNTDEETGKPSDKESEQDEDKEKGKEDEKEKKDEDKEKGKEDEKEKKDEDKEKGKEKGKEDEKKDEDKQKDEKEKKEGDKKEDDKKEDDKKDQPVAPDSEEPQPPDEPEKPVAPETEQEQQPQQEEDQPVAPEPELPQPPEPEEPAEPQQPEQSEQQLPESPPAEQPEQPDEPEQPVEEQPQQEPQYS